MQHFLCDTRPKRRNLRDIGGLLEEAGYEVRVLDLINMEKSHCYNPFVYLQSDNDVQRLVTNLFQSTTPKGAQSNDPFWDTAASMLLLALIFYLKYEAPEEEQNFSMVMEMLEPEMSAKRTRPITARLTVCSLSWKKESRIILRSSITRIIIPEPQKH